MSDGREDPAIFWQSTTTESTGPATPPAGLDGNYLAKVKKITKMSSSSLDCPIGPTWVNDCWDRFSILKPEQLFGQNRRRDTLAKSYVAECWR